MGEVLPENWVETIIKDIAETSSGGTPNTNRTDYWNGDIPWINSGMLKDDVINSYSKLITEKGLKESSAKLFPVNTVVIALTGATTGRVGLLKIETTTNQSVTGIFPNELNNSKFVFYYLKSIRNSILENALGTAQPHINKKIVDETKIPLPPLAEQERIVAKLDVLFAQHEAIKKALERIPQLLKDFRQQVLTQAVTGKLTEEWRKGKELEEWRRLDMNSVGSTRLGKMLDQNKNTGLEYEYLGNINVQWNCINLKHLKKIKIEAEEIEKFNLKKGDVLICEGGEAGRSAIWELENSKVIFQKALHRVRLKEGFLSKFLIYNLELDTKSGRMSELYTGTTIKHLTGQSLAKYIINWPPLTEQNEIVLRVESLFAKADKIEEKYKALKAKVAILPQAILHKAFKGELVEQLPTDGNAKDLLKEIMKLKMK